MVRFVNITIEFQDGSTHKSRSLAEFNAFRCSRWDELISPDRSNYIREFNSHSTAEREWENRYQLPVGSLRGVCLLFGDRITAGEKLALPEAREVLSHPGTEARIELDEPTGTAYVLICSGQVSWAPKCFLYSYPISETLIPQFEDMSSDSDSE